MRIQVLSDLHLEFGPRSVSLNNPDILVLAGDIHVGTKAIDWILETSQDITVIYVLGNHEFYRNSYPKLLNEIQDLTMGTNIHILENNAVEYDGVTFHGSTLWTDFALFGDSVLAGLECQLKLNDYHLIRKSPEFSKLHYTDTLMAHQESMKWLRKSLLTSNTEKNIVISHHAPSIGSIEDKYKNDPVSAGFASNLESSIEELNPNLWIHGHVHSCHDYIIGNTRIVCNSAGYLGESVSGFNDKMVIEI